MKRGDVVTTAIAGDYGKPRPAVVIETDLLPGTDSVLVCLITTVLREDVVQRRILIEPTAENGLRDRSQVMIEKIFAARRSKCHGPIGRLGRQQMADLTDRLAVIVGLVG